MGVDVLPQDEATILLHFLEQVVKSILFRRPVVKFTEQLFLGGVVREITQSIILVSLIFATLGILHHFLGELLALGVLELEASTFFECFFLCVLDVMFYGVLTKHILTHLQLILLGCILASAGLHVGGSPSASLPAI